MTWLIAKGGGVAINADFVTEKNGVIVAKSVGQYAEFHYGDDAKAIFAEICAAIAAGERVQRPRAHEVRCQLHVVVAGLKDHPVVAVNEVDQATFLADPARPGACQQVS